MNTIRILYIGGFLSATKFAKIGEMYFFFLFASAIFGDLKSFLWQTVTGMIIAYLIFLRNESDREKMCKLDHRKNYYTHSVIYTQYNE